MKRLAVTMFFAAVIASIILAVGWIALWFDAFRDWDKGWTKPLTVGPACDDCLAEFRATLVIEPPKGWRWEDCMGDFCG